MGKVQFIHGPKGEELVVLPRAQYDALIAAIKDEDEADVELYDQRKAELSSKPNAILPVLVSELLLRGDSRLKAIRRWRGIKQLDLAAKAGIAQGYLSDLENRRRKGTSKKLLALAAILDVPLAWLE